MLLIVGNRIDTAVGASGYLCLCREDGVELRKLVWREMTLPEQLFALRVSVGEFLPDELLLPIPVSPDEQAIYREACRLASHLRATRGYGITITLHERVTPALPPAGTVLSHLDIASVWAEKAADLKGKPEAEVADALAIRRGNESGYEYAELFYLPMLGAKFGDRPDEVQYHPHPTSQ
ncbi:hypothetical protein PQR70_27375 [Paraburkholderia madseniana]|uniref:Uncharacterized protein n=1 Tax=Paraburkholderia madseniana TaxID=2599607 RepID=A0AAP5EWT5_9BURK|nr:MULTISPECIES: hypothetical protein [Paraburkholderia]MCX4148467.1 hypothetical protein [Paraburkholderia madseniana]MDN7151405.1 hypothetical protein [Paraburkholderia sp. WS6]MDQ6410285.1 hypothetical protein [Paraburkholderia madseniana]